MAIRRRPTIPFAPFSHFLTAQGAARAYLSAVAQARRAVHESRHRGFRPVACPPAALTPSAAVDGLDDHYVQAAVGQVRAWQRTRSWSEARAVRHAADRLLRSAPLDIVLRILDLSETAMALPHRQRYGLARRALVDLLTRAVRVVH